MKVYRVDPVYACSFDHPDKLYFVQPLLSPPSTLRDVISFGLGVQGEEASGNSNYVDSTDYLFHMMNELRSDTALESQANRQRAHEHVALMLRLQSGDSPIF